MRLETRENFPTEKLQPAERLQYNPSFYQPPGWIYIQMGCKLPWKQSATELKRIHFHWPAKAKTAVCITFPRNIFCHAECWDVRSNKYFSTSSHGKTHASFVPLPLNAITAGPCIITSSSLLPPVASWTEQKLESNNANSVFYFPSKDGSRKKRKLIQNIWGFYA